MPYKDPERKRQWEREHRDERNARRRKSIVSSTFHPSHGDAPRRNPIAVQAQGTGVVVTVGVVMGLSFLLMLLFARWRSLGLPKPPEGVQPTL
jgi:hypothetical protein